MSGGGFVECAKGGPPAPSVAPGNEMMRAVNAGDVTQDNFTAYRFIHVDGKAVVSQGLLNRRKAEYQMYSEGDQ